MTPKISYFFSRRALSREKTGVAAIALEIAFGAPGDYKDPDGVSGLKFHFFLAGKPISVERSITETQTRPPYQGKGRGPGGG